MPYIDARVMPQERVFPTIRHGHLYNFNSLLTGVHRYILMYQILFRNTTFEDERLNLLKGEAAIVFVDDIATEDNLLYNTLII